MTTDTKPLAKFSWSLKSNTGLSSSGSQDNITPEMYGAIMGVLADPGFPQVEIARLQAQVAELQKLSVRNIMLAIVPGDGSGEEIYAESVEDVVSTLTAIDEKNETLQAQVDALAVALECAKRTMADYGQCDNDNWPCFQAVCAALAAVGR